MGVAFTNSGQQVTFVDVDGQTGSLDIVSEKIADKICKKVWRNLSKEEWERFIPDTDYECTCPNLKPGSGFKNYP